MAIFIKLQGKEERKDVPELQYTGRYLDED